MPTDQERQEAVKKYMLEVSSKVFERAVAYTNVIMVAGYAALFAIWAYTKDSLPKKAVICIATMILISLCAFIMFEVFKMITSSRQFFANRKIALSDLATDKFFENLKTVQKNEAKYLFWLMPIWYVTLVIAIVPAFGAAGLLLYNFMAILLGCSPWPA